MTIKIIFSSLATIIAISSLLPYIKDLRAKKVTPHFYSWLVWSLMTSIYFVAQITGGAGVGAIATAVTGVLTIYVTVIAYFRSKKIIKTIDTISLVLSLIALIIWVVTKDPVYAVILVTVSDFLGFIPTVRKTMIDPYSENLSLYSLASLKHLLVIFSLESLTLTTSFYTIYLLFQNLIFVIMVIVRRRKII